MRSNHLAILLLALFACANPNKLARQSEIALKRGDLREAYEKAKRGIEKDPQHRAARDAYNAASQSLAIDYQARVVAVAAAPDTIPAADLALEYRRFREEVAQHGSRLDSVPEYSRAEQTIIRGAARAYYNRGVIAMQTQRPRVAVGEFERVHTYVRDFQDVAERLAEARRVATVRVAVLPFADRIGVPGLSQEIADSIQRRLAQHVGEFEFTQLISASEIDRYMTVAEARNLQRDNALEVGRRIGADWVVIGRYRGLSTKTSQKTDRVRMYQRLDRKDTSVIATTRWDEITVPIVTRTRDVGVTAEFEVINVSNGTVMGANETNVNAFARVAWTDFVAVPPFDYYALVPPDERKADPKRGRDADAAWKLVMGPWELRDFMRTTREQRNRSRYGRTNRHEFYSDSRENPIWLGELPSENELVFVAMRDLWRDVLSKLKELDKQTF